MSKRKFFDIKAVFALIFVLILTLGAAQVTVFANVSDGMVSDEGTAYGNTNDGAVSDNSNGGSIKDDMKKTGDAIGEAVRDAVNGARSMTGSENELTDGVRSMTGSENEMTESSGSLLVTLVWIIIAVAIVSLIIYCVFRKRPGERTK